MASTQVASLHAQPLLSRFLPKPVFLVSGARTPIASYMGAYKNIAAFRLGSLAIEGALRRAGIEGSQVDQVVVGQALQAGCGQAPQRQAALCAGIPSTTDVFSVNKICASGMKAVCLGASSIALGHHNSVLAVGMESMSKVPYLFPKSTEGDHRIRHVEMKDGVLLDGLWDPYNVMHMGTCTERTVLGLEISRADQDAYAVESYKRAAEAWKSGVMQNEGIEPVTVAAEKQGETKEITQDEEFSRIKLDKVASLRPCFKREGGTITAANSSKISDGAAALMLMSEEKVLNLDIKPLARILSYADAALAPVDFALAPDLAIRRALRKANLQSVDYYEINEAFAAVVLANMQLLRLDPSRVNVHGGAISLGHPLGMSGVRIILSLINVLHTRNAKYGCAAICNGGGGATAIIIEKI
ncbi:UNVERIFIED_CONTAM: acetyl-CoA acetyltransferase [Hammondia hammondi]|eukprot:XP_008888176.1 acetyl-CoA acetyltransferase [Hammondia hammondi]